MFRDLQIQIRIATIYSFVLCILLYSCQEENKELKATIVEENFELFDQISPTKSGIRFTNQITEEQSSNLGFYDYYYNGGGVAIADINNDDLPDIFFAGNQVANRLYLNKGNLAFEDISTKANIQSGKWSTGVTAVDINGDGWLDFYVCNTSTRKNAAEAANQLYINNGDNTFTERANEYGIDDNALSTHASFLDYDKDGDLDLFVLNHTELLGRFANEFHEEIQSLSAEKYARQSCRLYRNDGKSFKDITIEAGIQKPAYGLGVICADLNDDGWTDIYVSNDFFIPDFYFINQKDGTFSDQINQKMGHVSYYSMGCDAADINNDGLLDIAAVDMTPGDHVRNKTLMASMDVSLFRYLTETQKYIPQYMFNSIQLNNGYGFFSEIGALSKTAQTDWSWAALLADFDNDGLKDYFVTNGYLRDTKHNDWRAKVIAKRAELGGKMTDKAYFDLLMTAEQNPVVNKLFKNNGDFTFSDKSSEWGMKMPSFSNGAAYGDLDLDGDLDLVINNINDNAFLYRNNANKLHNNFIQVKLYNSKSPGSTYNAKVYVRFGENEQMIEFNPSRGYQSSVGQIIHFGIGQIKRVDELRIEWPDNTETKILNPELNKIHIVDESKTEKQTVNRHQTVPPFVDISSQQSLARTSYKENYFDDFEKEILLPHKQTTWGPCLCKGDVNNDQLEDYYIGSSAGESGQLFIQFQTGKFAPAERQPWEAHKKREDGGCVFVDINNDGYKDLYVSSGGGGALTEGDIALQDRVYMNNKSKGFIYERNALPAVRSNSGKVAKGDIDNDGDVDIVVAGLGKPSAYPFASKSYILENENGKLKNATSKYGKDFERMGIVHDLLLTDFNGDEKLDILAIGEWMNILLFENKNQKFVDVSSELGLDNTCGWWYSAVEGDFDMDGDMDYVLGNLGLNNKFNPSVDKPLHIFANDFDDNGSLDIVLSKHYKQQLVPVRGKECSTEQMPFISEKFKTYQAFSESSLTDIYSQAKLDEALHYELQSFASVYMENNNGSFVLKPLPMEAQFSPILNMVVHDVNSDGYLDVICAGNIYETEPETPRYDAGKGIILYGDGSGSFKGSHHIIDNGLFLFPQVNAMELIDLGPSKIATLVVGNNNAPTNFYALRR